MTTGPAGPAVVVDRDDALPGTAVLTLRPAVAVPPPPGGHVDVRVDLPGGPAVRSYSLVDLGDVPDGAFWRIAVRLDPDGAGGSRWMHGRRPGDTLTVSAPVDGFPPSPGTGPAVLLAAGIGVTPVIGLARTLRDRGAEPRVVQVARTRAAMPFAELLAVEHPGRYRAHATAEDGRLSAPALVDGVPPDGTLYVCGPLGLLDEVRAAWHARGRSPAALRFETFGTSGASPARPFAVDVPRRGVTVQVPVGVTVLDALEAAGVEVLSSCRRGECGLCRVRVLDAPAGLDHRDVFLSAAQRDRGDELCACVSRAPGGRIAVDC